MRIVLVLLFVFFNSSISCFSQISDSDKLYKERKRVSKKYPELTRLQVKLIAKLNMEKLDD